MDNLLKRLTQSENPVIYSERPILQPVPQPVVDSVIDEIVALEMVPAIGLNLQPEMLSTVPQDIDPDTILKTIIGNLVTQSIGNR